MCGCAVAHEKVCMFLREKGSSYAMSFQSDLLYKISSGLFSRRIFKEAPTAVSVRLFVFSKVDIIYIAVVFFSLFRQVKSHFDNKVFSIIFL